jgi:hypothetical protein
MKLFLEAGLNRFSISHKKEVYEEFITATQEYDPKKFDYGVNFGAGFKTDGGISLEYHLGLGDLYDTNDKAFNRSTTVLFRIDL